ncbi:MAG: tryptophan--tRNA ligase, partial [Solirubrobacteraceae bacterium]
MRIFSGVQPTGRKHLGNYIGAFVPYVEGQERGEGIYCIVDLHATTVAYDPSKLRSDLYDLAAVLLAMGLDPGRCVLFRQSDVIEHAELQWLLNSVTGYGELSRMTQFKDKSDQHDFISAGIFNYPILMVADILLYNTDQVPVGDDQRQHV